VYGERKRNFVGQHFWARGYFVSTVGRDETVIREYIRHQEREDQRDALKAQYAAAGVALKDYLSPLQAASEAAYLSLSWRLMKTNKQALLDYGKLVGSHGRLVRRRWILNEAMAEAELLSAPEIGPVAHTAAIYEAMEQMRSSSIGKKALIALAIPLLIPLLILLSIQVPIQDILLTLLKTLA
jgi:hypothetical protein